MRRRGAAASTLLLLLLALPPGCAGPAPAEVPPRARPRAAPTVCESCLAHEPEGLVYPDGRAICGGCHAGAVLTTAAARPLLARAAAELERLLPGVFAAGELGGLLADIELRLVGRPELIAEAGPELGDARLLGLTVIEEERLGGQVLSRRQLVYAAYGLPAPQLLGVLAHELVHVWQVLRGGALPAGASRELREGAALHAQRRLLAAAGEAAWAARVIPDGAVPRDPSLRAWRRFQELVAARGEVPALRASAEPGVFPPGF